MMIRTKIGARHRGEMGGPDFNFVDFVMDEIDLVVNPEYGTVDSGVVRKYLSDFNITDYDIVTGDVLEEIQYVTTALYQVEDVVKIKLLTHEVLQPDFFYNLRSLYG